MNSDYVKKFTNNLQNIPAHKPSANAGGQTDTRTMNRPATKKGPTGKRQTDGNRRPVWIVPTAAGTLLPAHRPQAAAEERKFVRPCCASRRPDSVRPERRVDCWWETAGKNYPPTPPPAASAILPKGDVISEEECPATPEPKVVSSSGDGTVFADNVNHQRSSPAGDRAASQDPTATGDGHAKRGPKRTAEEFRDRQSSSSWAGMLSKAHPSTQPTGGKLKNSHRTDAEEDTTDYSLDEAGLECAQVSRNTSDHERRLFTFQPIRTLQFLTLELTTKIRDLGPEHRSLYKIGRELSDVVKILTQTQQLKPSGINTTGEPAAGHPKAASTGRCGTTECENCQLLQRNVQSDRDRHAQESSQQQETINNLKRELEHERKATDAMAEQYRRLEEQCAQLKLAVDTKHSLELQVIQDLKRKVKEARSKERQLEQERTTLESRLTEALMKTEQMEFLLHTQDTNFSRVKSELSCIHKLSARQIEFLDAPGDGADGDERASSKASSASAGTVRQRLSRAKQRRSGQGNDDSSFGLLSSETRASSGARKAQRSERGFSSLPLDKQPDSIPAESMPSLASTPALSDRDNSSHAVRRRSSTSSDWTTTTTTTAGQAATGGIANRDNDREEDRWPVRSTSARSRQRANPSSTSSYSTTTSTGRLHRKSGEAEKVEGDVSGAMKWQNGDGDKNHRRSPAGSCTAADYERGTQRAGDLASRPTVPSRPATRSDDGQLDSPLEVTLDDHQQFVAALAENITLPPSPRPYRSSNVSQLSGNDDEPEPRFECQRDGSKSPPAE